MPGIPRDRAPDSTLSLLRQGYAFIPERCRRHRSDIFETRLMLKRAVCITGEEAARVFYHPGRFTRTGALPLSTLALIQDLGSVMVMDGEAHRRRKRMFLSLMTPDRLRRLAELTAEHWRAQVRAWQGRGPIELFREAHLPLTRAICAWARIPLGEGEAEARAREFEGMVEGTGSVGPRNWRGHLLRARTERWARSIVRRIRAGEIGGPGDGAAQVIAAHRDEEGRLLDEAVAAVELINVLRPTVANARYAVFAAMALHARPECGERIRAEGEPYLDLFEREVRRFYPFIPFIGGRVLAPFAWRGHGFAEGDWVLIDLYGTNHDPRLWDEPEAFRPERFQGWTSSGFDLVSHGAGASRDTHRCPGEGITVEQTKTIARLLATEMRYEVPEQDLSIDLARIPALPRSRFTITDVALAS